LSQWKVSPVDEVAVKLWPAYTRARDEMLRRTHSPQFPWHVVHANDKHAARLNVIRHLLAQLHYGGRERRLLAFNPAVVFAFDEAQLGDGTIAK
jgi:polyphosphate kinase